MDHNEKVVKRLQKALVLSGVVIFLLFIGLVVTDGGYKKEIDILDNNVTQLQSSVDSVSANLKTCKVSLDQKKDCPVCKTCEVCKVAKPVVCKSDNLVYSNTEISRIKADLYINLMRNEQKGFYDDILNYRYDDARQKLAYSIDYVNDALGFYYLAEIEKDSDLYMGYDNLLKCFTNIRVDITNFEDAKEYSFDDVFDNDNMKYCDYYTARILKHNLNTKEDIIMIEW